MPLQNYMYVMYTNNFVAMVSNKSIHENGRISVTMHGP